MANEDQTTLAFILGGEEPSPGRDPSPVFGPAQNDGKKEVERAALRRFRRLIKSDDASEDEMVSAFRDAMKIFQE